MTVFEAITDTSTLLFAKILMDSDELTFIPIELNCWGSPRLFKNKQGITFEILTIDPKMGYYFQPIARYDQHMRCSILKDYIENEIDKQLTGLESYTLTDSKLFDMSFQDKALMSAFSVRTISAILEQEQDIRLNSLGIKLEIWEAGDGDFNIYLDDIYNIPYGRPSVILGVFNIDTRIYAPTLSLERDGNRLRDWGLFSVHKII